MKSHLSAPPLAPGPSGFNRRQSLRRIRRQPLDEYLALHTRFGDMVRLARAPRPIYLISHPDAIRYVLRDNARNYRKGVFFDLIAALQGNGLLTSEAELWRRQRRLAQPAFQPSQLIQLGPIIEAEVASVAHAWRHAARIAEPVNIASWMHRLTFRIVGRALLGIHPDALDQVGMQLQAIASNLIPLIASSNPYQRSLPSWVPTAKRRRFRQAVNGYNQIVQRLIDTKRQLMESHASEPTDLLARLVTDQATSDGMSAQQLRDEVITIIGAGVETSANALSWAWHLVAQHYDVERQLQVELDTVLGQRPPILTDLSQLPYSRAIIDETLRLYPPSAVLPRQANAADRIAGYPIPQHAVVIMSQYVTHRHPDFWPQPEQFQPERFGLEEFPHQHRYAYFPFGEGQRLCIGKPLALMEMHLALAALFQQYSFSPVPGRPVQAKLAATLQPHGGIWMTIHERT